MPLSRLPRINLDDVADARGGLFTSGEARRGGLDMAALEKGVKKGEIVVVRAANVYRFARYAPGPHEALIAVTLVLGDAVVISHESSISTYGIGDVPSPKMHLTLVRDIRVTSVDFPGVEFHGMTRPNGVLDQADIDTTFVSPRTRLARALFEAMADGADPKPVRVALERGKEAELVNEREVARHFSIASPRVRSLLMGTITQLFANATTRAAKVKSNEVEFSID